MRTNFSAEQMKTPLIQLANNILRRCVHCGFCNSTCPTYVLKGDELDGPRGRISMIKGMFERGGPASEKLTLHIDRCLSCLSCTSTCPSSVDYMHLVDKARIRIEETYIRPLFERVLRSLVANLLPNPKIFRLALIGAWIVKPLAQFAPGKLGAIAKLAPTQISPPSSVERPHIYLAKGTKRKRVALLTGCAQKVLDPEINEATIRLLTRHGCEVVVPAGSGCCGALVHHMGRVSDAEIQAKENIKAWEQVASVGGLDAVVINASGCGTVIKDYGFMFREDDAWVERAKKISDLAKDVTEVMIELGIEKSLDNTGLRVTYHSACSLQHGQKIKTQPVELLRAAGFDVHQPAESHLCCGSAGTYNIFQPEIAEQLLDRKVGNLQRTEPDVIAAGNIGCMLQLRGGMDAPVVHTVSLLDWATGGPKPERMA
jgi:glycolate oxidase iron-sulfur subunit